MATVDQNIAAATARIDNLLADAQSFVDVLRNFENTALVLDAPGSRTFSIATGDGLANAINSQPERPQGLDFVSPGNVPDPPVPVIREALQQALPEAPTDAPEIVIPNAPVLDIPPPPTQPFIETVVTPDSPVVLLPDVPVLEAIIIPQEPLIVLPLFTEQFPEEELPFTATPFNFNEPDFADELLDEITEQTLSDLEDGGFGIDPRDEDQLVGRVRDREARAGRTREAQVLRNFGSRGHSLPAGALDDALRQSQFDTQATISAAEREIYIVRADLFRKTREFQLANGLSIVQFLGNLFVSRQERSLKAAVFVSEFSVTVFDALVRRFNIQVTAFQVAAQAHNILVQAELAKIEIFKEQINAQRLVGDINEQLVDIFTAQVNAARAIVDIFEAEVRAAATRAEIERIKIQAFGEQVNAFNSQVNAERSRIEVFVAQLRGEQTKLQVFQTEVQVYGTEIQAAEVRTRIDNINVNADIERGRLNLQSYLGTIEQFKSNLTREVERVRSLVSVYAQDTSSFDSLIGGWKAFYDSVDRNTEVFLRTITANADTDARLTDIELARQEKEARIQLEASQTGVDLYRDLVGAAQGALNSLVVKEDVNA
jgi:hypothetical protein